MTFQNAGFIGLGDQGGGIAERMLSQGVKLRVWARRPEALEPFVALGGTACPNPKSLGAACDEVGVCVVDEAGVRAVLDGANGVFAGMKPGGVIAIHSTISPEACRDLSKIAAGHGLTLIDAPVSGGRKGALAGTMSVMIGADPQVAERCRPLFSTFATTIVRLGPVGSGQVAKLVNNTMTAANMALVHVARGYAEELGLDPVAFLDLASVSGGRSHGLNLYVNAGHLGNFQHAAKMLRKDVGLLTALAGNCADQTLVEVANRFNTYAEEAAT